MAKKTNMFVEQGTLKLQRPLMVDDVPVEAIRYDFDLLQCDRYLNALDRAEKRSNGQVDVTEEQAFNLFCEAVCVCHKQMEPRDLKRLHAKDVLLGARIGRGFFIQAALGALTKLGAE